MSICRTAVLVLVAVLCLPGCESRSSAPAGAPSSGADPEVELALDLSAAGRCYHNHIDTHGKGPSGWDAFRQFAGQGGLDQGVLDRLQAAGYQFVWGADLRGGVSMSETMLAQSGSRAARLMLDGSLANVSREVVEKARQSKRKTGSSKAQAAAAPAPADTPPPPSTPLEQAVYLYLVLCDEWFAALRQIQDYSSAERVKEKVRSLDTRFDKVGEQLARQGVQVDLLAIPPKYRDAVQGIGTRQSQEDARLMALADAARINQLFLSDERELGPVGPMRTRKKIQEEFSRRSPDQARNAEAGGPHASAVSAAAASRVQAALDRLEATKDSMGRGSGQRTEPAAPGLRPAETGTESSSTRASHAPRTWSDQSGRFRIRAALVSHDQQEVRLRKREGDEIAVPVDRLSRADRDYLAQLAAEPSDSANPAGAPSFQQGTAVEVLWGRRWFPASVLKANGKRFFIQYDGWSDRFNEWVGPDRIRTKGG